MATTNRPCSRPRAAALAAAAFAAAAAAAQPSATTSVTITGRNERTPSFAGFGDANAAAAPLQVQRFGLDRLEDAGVTRIGDLTRLDASTGAAYDAPGYWSIIAVRGYALDNRSNYRRDGLPVNAETAIPLDNKAALEVLKGASGIQAGTSAPGGLVNLVVKRPVAGLRSASVEWRQPGSVLVAADLSDRDETRGWRLNVAAERLDPMQRDTRGRRWLAAAAGELRLGPGRLEAEVEFSHQRQPSVVAFSMLGDRVPAPGEIDPRLNLNRQPWGAPVEFGATTASLRWTQPLAADWTLRLHALAQRLRTDDRTAFPFGDYDLAFNCGFCDRYASDGSFSYWEFVSNGERRDTLSAEAAASGRWRALGLEHRVEAGLLLTRHEARFGDQVFDVAGTGSVFGLVTVPPSAGTPSPNTNRDERSTELFVRDAVELRPGTALWAGLRHSRLERASVRTSGDPERTDYRQRFTTPWLGVSQRVSRTTMLYASWGRGVETAVVPNRPADFDNAGQPLPALQSRQVEAGLKHTTRTWDAGVALFDIERPFVDDSTRIVGVDGSQHHRGAEVQIESRSGRWRWQAAAARLWAERKGSSQAANNGRRPVNVPATTLRAGAAYRLAQGLEWQAAIVADGPRQVRAEDPAARAGGWSRVDAGLRWTQRLGTARVTWRAGVDNVFDRRAWLETPTQFGHVYLYPLQPRTVHASAHVVF